MIHLTLVVLLAAIAVSNPARCALPDEDFEQPYFEEAPDRYAKDQTLIEVGGVYHVFYVSGSPDGGWQVPGDEIAIGHATTTDLEHWTVHAPAIWIDPPNGWKARNVWAPHVTAVTQPFGGSGWAYVMAYAGVDSSYNQRIGFAASDDLFAWTDLTVGNAGYHPDPAWADWDAAGEWSACRDPDLVELNGGFVLLTTAFTRPGYGGVGRRGAISLATSPDGVIWTDAGVPMVVNDDTSLMSASYLQQNPVTADWHLVYTRTAAPGGVHYLTSSFPIAGWDIGTDQSFDPLSFASEIEQIGSAYVYSHAEDFLDQDGLAMRGVRFSTLTWPGGVPTFERVNELDADWTLFEGDLGAQPTYGDRPAHRGGQPSNLEGLFWINTAEDYSGPIGGGCATCDADESQVGVLRSDTFQLGYLGIGLWVGGPLSADCHVAMVEAGTGTVIALDTGDGEEAMSYREWDVAAWHGHDVYLEIVDHDPAAHIAVDAIQGLSPLAIDDERAAPAASGPALRASPNPARPGTRITIRIDVGSGGQSSPDASSAAEHLTPSGDVAVAIYDVAGRLVRTLDERAAAGGAPSGTVVWDGRDDRGRMLAAGHYFLRATHAGRVAATRITLTP